MTREEKIQWLVTNRKEWEGEEGTEILNVLAPARLDTIFDHAQAANYVHAVANLAAEGFVHNGAQYKFDPDQGGFVVNGCEEDHELDEEEMYRRKKAPPTENRAMTLNEMYEHGDEAVRGMIDTWREHDAKVRLEALTRLTSNCRSDEAKRLVANSLNKLPTRELQQMADAQAPVTPEHGPGPVANHQFPGGQQFRPQTPPSYLGAAGAPPARTNNGADQDDVLELPTANLDQSASPRLLEMVRNGKA